MPYHNNSPKSLSVEVLKNFIESADGHQILTPIMYGWSSGILAVGDGSLVVLSYDWLTEYGVITVMGSVKLRKSKPVKATVYASCDNDYLPLFMSSSILNGSEESYLSIKEVAQGIAENLEWRGESINQSLDEVGIQTGEAVLNIGSVLCGYLREVKNG